MSRLIAVILLSILMFPLAVVVYLLTFFVFVVGRGYGSDDAGFVIAGLAGCTFIGVYWLVLWRKTVVWTSARRTFTTLSAAGAGLLGIFIGVVMGQMVDEDEIGFIVFVATLFAPPVWVFATILIWRETAAERAARLDKSASALVCPTCGYNLTGLTDTRCPECGTQFTLDQLVANQPKREQVEIEG
jgi:hypothetical protein